VAAPVKLPWTRIAAADLRAAWEYIAAENAAAAEGVLEKILRGVEALEHHPQLGRAGRVEGTRELVISGTPFVVAYRLRRDEILVLAVLHGARKWPESF
jgi:toxin ParE1/3/4